MALIQSQTQFLAVNQLDGHDSTDEVGILLLTRYGCPRHIGPTVMQFRGTLL